MATAFGVFGEGGPGDSIPSDPTRSGLAFDGAGVGVSYVVGGILLVVGFATFALGLMYAVRG